MMRSNIVVILLLVVVVFEWYGVMGYKNDGGSTRIDEGSGEKWFMLKESKQVVKTKAGEMRLVNGIGANFISDKKPMHIGFITMEPQSLFIPHYLDSNLIIFIHLGEARIGSIRKDELVEQQLKGGDVYTINAGSAFYLENIAEGQRLDVICAIDTSHGLSWNDVQSFFIGGGMRPTSILSGFSSYTLSTAFNVSEGELEEIRTSQKSGAIVFLNTDSKAPSLWKRFMELEHDNKKAHLKRMFDIDEVAKSEEEKPRWSLGKLLLSIFRTETKREDNKITNSDDVCNIFDRSPDFKNNYGWSLEVDESAYTPLKHSGIGIYFVNLTAGSMLAPHINPTASEYGIVLRGTGNIQIVYPNGSLAMNAMVSEGDVFWVPRFFPFCQISSKSGPFEFFGFTTSSRKSHPQFLVGHSSILQSMRGPEFATAFGIPEEHFYRFIDSQNESTILPVASVAPQDHEKMNTKVEESMEKIMQNVIMFW